MVKIRFLFLLVLMGSLFSIKTPTLVYGPKPPKIVEIKPEEPKIVIPAPIIPTTPILEPRGEMPPLAFFYPDINLPLSMSLDEPIKYEINSYNHNIITDIGDVALLPPELVLDAIVKTIDSLLGIKNPNTVTGRILDFHVEPTRSHLFSIFTENITKREMRYFAGFGDSYLNTPEVEEGLAQIQASDLMADQRKILWDVGKNTYLSKYRVKVDNIRDEAFYFTDWRGIDFAVLPPLVAGYLYYRGFEKKISFLDTEARISMEPLQSWIGHNDLLVGAGVEWAPKDWPVKFIVALGVDKGDVNVQFVGIGTSIGTVKQLLFRQADPRR
jgi:hypothetical protein